MEIAARRWSWGHPDRSGRRLRGLESETSPAPPRPVIRFTITLPPGQALAGLHQPALALSADGSQLAYVATTTGQGAQQIYLRAMNAW